MAPYSQACITYYLKQFFIPSRSAKMGKLKTNVLANHGPSVKRTILFLYLCSSDLSLLPPHPFKEMEMGY